MTCVLWTYGLQYNPDQLRTFARLNDRLWNKRQAQAFSGATTTEAFRAMAQSVPRCPQLGTPKQWGPPVWKLIHDTAELFRTRRRKIHILWLFILGTLLPCEKCRTNFSALLRSTESVRRLRRVTTREDFRKFCFFIHKEVSKHKK